MRDISGHQLHDNELQILAALRGIRYGSVEIIIHDSKVVQIERKEKMRVEPNQPRMQLA